MKAAGADASVSSALLKEISELLGKAAAALEDLKWKEKEGEALSADARKQAFFYRDTIVPAMEALPQPRGPFRDEGGPGILADAGLCRSFV